MSDTIGNLVVYISGYDNGDTIHQAVKMRRVL